MDETNVEYSDSTGDPYSSGVPRGEQNQSNDLQRGSGHQGQWQQQYFGNQQNQSNDHQQAYTQQGQQQYAGNQLNQSNDQQQAYSEQGQPQYSGNQQFGAGEGGGGTEYSVQASMQWRQGVPGGVLQPGVQYYQQHQQQGVYEPQNNYDAPTGNPPPAHHPPSRPPSNQPYTPPNPPPPVNAQGTNLPFGSGLSFAPTTIVPQNQQAVPAVTPSSAAAGPGEWSSGIFDCFQDLGGCGLASTLPCIVFGQIAEIASKGENPCAIATCLYGVAFYFGFPCLLSFVVRTKMRRAFNLKGDLLGDCCIHTWCEICALAQEYREIKFRGVNPARGYNSQKDRIARAMQAPASQQMERQPPVPPPKAV